jgi:hypothetical protein
MPDRPSRPDFGHNPEIMPSFSLNDVERGYIKAIGNRQRINPLSFKDYDQTMVAADLLKVEQYKQSNSKKDTAFELEMLKLVGGSEHLISTMIEGCGWMGSEAEVVDSSEYDDFVNGIDSIAKLAGGNNYLGLAFDFTFNSEAVNKIKRIHNEIDNGKLPVVKYLETDTFKGQMVVARVVISLDRAIINDLMSKKLDLDRYRKLMRSATIDKQAYEQYKQRVKEISVDLANHPLQIDILNQIVVQVEEYLERVLSKSEGSKNKETFISLYNSTLAVTRPILEQKQTDITFEDSYLKQAGRLYIHGEETLKQMLSKAN